MVGLGRVVAGAGKIGGEGSASLDGSGRQAGVLAVPGWVARLRVLRVPALVSLGFAVAALLAAWLVPPMLDWGRYRASIAAIASAELGRPVVIAGDITLRLLPETVLTASDVTLPDQGDGVSARLRWLRLQVAMAPMLGGHIVPRDLVLGAPVLALPWPLPAGIAAPLQPRVPRGFAARMEAGSLRIGAVALTGITASLHGAGDAGSVGSEGVLQALGQDWHFAAALGAPDPAGRSSLNLAIEGRDVVQGTQARFQGAVSDGVLEGAFAGHGQDLSRLIPAPARPWTASGPITASAARVEAPALDLMLDDLPAKFGLTLSLAAPSRLELTLAAPVLDVAPWVRALGAPLGSRIPIGIDVAADTMPLAGDQLHAVRAHLTFAADRTAIDSLSARLPGAARLEGGFALRRDPAGVLSIEGPARLEAPDLRATLRWLQPSMPALLGKLPGGVLQSASLTGDWRWGGASFSVSGLAGRLDGANVAGGFGVGLGARPGFGIGLTVDQLKLDPWLPDGMQDFAGVGHALTGIDGDIHIQAPSAAWHEFAPSNFVLDLHTGGGGVAVKQMAVDAWGAHFAASGLWHEDGALTDGRLAATTEDAARTYAVLPRDRRFAPGLWHGPAGIELNAAGPARALAVTLRTDTGDLRVEAESLLDLQAGAATATITLRHPGAPRLAADLGFPDAQKWLETGSVALLAHARLSDGHVSVPDFELAAAALRIGGQMDADLTGTLPAISGKLRAESLALPGIPAGLDSSIPTGWLQSWQGHVQITADQVLVGLVPVAQSVAGDLTVGNGVALLELPAARIGEGGLRVSLAADTTHLPAKFALRGALTTLRIDGPLTGLPLDFDAGSADVSVDLFASGQTTGTLLATLSGRADAGVRDADLTGLDLAALRRALAAKPSHRRAAITAALSGGASPGMEGQIAAVWQNGTMVIAPAQLNSPEGAVTLSGMAALAPSALRISIQPPAPAPAIRLGGSWSAPLRTLDMPPAPPAPKRRKH